jgi:hypothetical protein
MGVRESRMRADADPSRADELARGVARSLADMGYESLAEFRVGQGRRVDVIGLGRDGTFIVVEIKTSEADFRGDGKWRDYLPFCDRFFFAVPEDFPRELLPEEHGLMIADAFAAAIVRPAPEAPMNGNRRRAQLLRFARTAAQRHRQATDPRL